VNDNASVNELLHRSVPCFETPPGTASDWTGTLGRWVERTPYAGVPQRGRTVRFVAGGGVQPTPSAVELDSALRLPWQQRWAVTPPLTQKRTALCSTLTQR